MKVKLYPFEWFFGESQGKAYRNVMSGSSGSDAEKGCISYPTKNYRAYVDVKEGKAVCFTVQIDMIRPYSEGGGRYNVAKHEFAADQSGVDEAEKWLNENL